jgi:hypothetical protein
MPTYKVIYRQTEYRRVFVDADDAEAAARQVQADPTVGRFLGAEDFAIVGEPEVDKAAS